jgi:hypothetical protein
MPPRYAPASRICTSSILCAQAASCGHKAIVPNATLLQGRPGYTRLMALERQLLSKMRGEG